MCTVQAFTDCNIGLFLLYMINQSLTCSWKVKSFVWNKMWEENCSYFISLPLNIYTHTCFFSVSMNFVWLFSNKMSKMINKSSIAILWKNTTYWAMIMFPFTANVYLLFKILRGLSSPMLQQFICGEIRQRILSTSGDRYVNIAQHISSNCFLHYHHKRLKSCFYTY